MRHLTPEKLKEDAERWHVLSDAINILNRLGVVDSEIAYVALSVWYKKIYGR